MTGPGFFLVPVPDAEVPFVCLERVGEGPFAVQPPGAAAKVQCRTCEHWVWMDREHLGLVGTGKVLPMCVECMTEAYRQGAATEIGPATGYTPGMGL